MYYSTAQYKGNPTHSKGVIYQIRVTWLMPEHMPAADYTVKVWMKDWITREEFACLTFDLTVEDIMA